MTVITVSADLPKCDLFEQTILSFAGGFTADKSG